MYRIVLGPKIALRYDETKQAMIVERIDPWTPLDHRVVERLAAIVSACHALGVDQLTIERIPTVDEDSSGTASATTTAPPG